MVKKAIDLEELQKLTKTGKKKSEKKNHLRQSAEDKKWDKEAGKIADEHIAMLPKMIKKEARAGRDSVDINLPGSYQLHDRVRNRISEWCWNNDLSTSTKTVHYSDDGGGSSVLVISWTK